MNKKKKQKKTSQKNQVQKKIFFYLTNRATYVQIDADKTNAKVIVRMRSLATNAAYSSYPLSVCARGLGVLTLASQLQY